ncbi:protein LURP-one-related 8 [Malania oleifera]|uniref:protein LURP-one-related 8 n=1 Tax=Malania oleifera TaxID=397392 RepID=UPI0025ADDD61|nr:protein LURP-one-related 8 [Malania oleifera]
MTKVYPNAASAALTERPKPPASSGNTTVLTVWKKSLLLNCSGFTVFDSSGNLVFRVDNYVAAGDGEMVLMDAAGKPLLTIRRKRLSLGDSWLVFEGETAVNPRFLVRKHVNLWNSRTLAHVSSGNGGAWSTSPSKNALYEIEGSYSQRCCAVYDGKRRRVAEIKQKEAVGGVGFGVDVFRLIVQPEMDTALAMALVILLDQMFGSSRR